MLTIAKTTICALALTLGLGAVTASADPVWPTTPRAAKKLVQDMPGGAWKNVITASLSLKFLVGKPIVAVFNPYDEAMENLTCDGKWSLVGPNAYNKSKGAPESIAPHSVGFIPTDGFDNYCQHSISAIMESGARHDGELSIPGDFTNSTAISFPATDTSVEWPATLRAAKTFVLDMPGDAWTRITSASLSLQFFVGKPIVAVFNPYDEAIDNVVCDSKWSLVGPNAYNKSKGAPESIAPHSVGFIPTDDFDGYCTKSIVGITESGVRSTGVLSIPGDFSNSTAILFPAEKN